MKFLSLIHFFVIFIFFFSFPQTVKFLNAFYSLVARFSRFAPVKLYMMRVCANFHSKNETENFIFPRELYEFNNERKSIQNVNGKDTYQSEKGDWKCN